MRGANFRGSHFCVITMSNNVCDSLIMATLHKYLYNFTVISSTAFRPISRHFAWWIYKKRSPIGFFLAVRTGRDPVTPCVTGMYSNQLN